jgi:HTH-type transcriptional regulator/antitoxin HipB
MRVHSVADVAAAVRGRRLDLGLTQSELANDSGISRKWISEFEAGKARAEFGLVMRVIEALGLSLDLGEGHSAAGTGRAIDLDDVIEEYETR